MKRVTFESKLKPDEHIVSMVNLDDVILVATQKRIFQIWKKGPRFEELKFVVEGE